jgi:hypothetical protein
MLLIVIDDPRSDESLEQRSNALETPVPGFHPIAFAGAELGEETDFMVS